jgi:ATP-dependent DNA helicase RecG
MMIRESVAHALAEPDFEQRGGEFAAVIWRDWLTERVIANLGLYERQRKALAHVKINGRITNAEYQRITGVSNSTALRDLGLLESKGIIQRVGMTGRRAHYVLQKPVKEPPNPPSPVLESNPS